MVGMKKLREFLHHPISRRGRAMFAFGRHPNPTNTLRLETEILRKVNKWCPPDKKPNPAKLQKAERLLEGGLQHLRNAPPAETKLLADATFKLNSRLYDIEAATVEAGLLEIYKHPWQNDRVKVKFFTPAQDPAANIHLPVSLNKHLGLLQHDLAKLLRTFANISKSVHTRFAPYLPKANSLGVGINKYDETITTLDAFLNQTYCKVLLQTGLVRMIHSEELETPVSGSNPSAPFVVTLDPLDGSPNIKTGNAFGAIFGVYREDLPQKGRNLAAAAIVIWAEPITFIYSAGNGVHVFKEYHYTYDSAFMLHFANIRLPDKPAYFGIGANELDWDAQLSLFKQHMLSLKMKVRYSGALVADASQVLHEGGIFAYPGTATNPNGKLRLAYECNPIAFLCEQAGGDSWDGKEGSILDVENPNIDARIPFYAGNPELIKTLKEAYVRG